MILSQRDKKQILIGFLDTIRCISDAEYQQRVWIEGRGPECHDFDEVVCNFFDAANPILEDYKIFGITEFQRQLLINFYKHFEIFSKENSFEPIFISNPEWKAIQQMAKEILVAFDYDQLKSQNNT